MRKILIALAIVAVAVVAAVAIYQFRSGGKSISAPASPSSFADAPVLPVTIGPDDRSIGKADAPVTIVEYASLTCPHCAHFDTEVLPAVKGPLIDSGKVRLVYRDFPLDGLALRAAMIVRCAGPERTFGLLNLMFSHQEQWIKNDIQSSIPPLTTLVAQAGISQADVDKCFADQSVQNAVVQSRADAERLYKIDSTPSFLINGRLTVGAPEPQELIALVDAVLPAGAKAAVQSSGPATGSSSGSSPQR